MHNAIVEDRSDRRHSGPGPGRGDYPDGVAHVDRRLEVGERHPRPRRQDPRHSREGDRARLVGQVADGTKYFVFGYMNRNWEEELDVPVGPGNSVSVGDADQGQPTRFLPRRNRFVFRVPVPKGFSDKDELVWTLITQGKTEKAYASLRLDYQIDDVVRASETGALGAGSSSPEIRTNSPWAPIWVPPAMPADGHVTVTVTP